MSASRANLTDYPPKILLAFGEAISGNYKIHEWLLKNGYQELAALASSLQADIPAFEWLMKNGFPQYAAFSNAIDNDEGALNWLRQHKFTMMALIVDAAWLRKPSMLYLKKKKHDIYLRLAFKIRQLKEDQHRDYNSYYKFHL
jgi:hypothetical protein